MKYLILILFLLLPVNLLSQTVGDYYMATTGSASGDGSIGDEFEHIQQFIDVAVPGDTLIVRGGRYDYYSAHENSIHRLDDSNINYGESGTKANPICVLQYEGDPEVILDCKDIISPGGYNTGFNVNRTEHWVFRGISIRNILQQGSSTEYEDTVSCVAFNFYECANMTFERVHADTIGGRAWYYESGAWDEEFEQVADAPFESDTTSWLNCDVHECADTLMGYIADEDPHHAAGNLADGWKTVGYRNGYFTWTGCRAWRVTDDGFDNGREATMIWDKCWVWDTGWLEKGNGNGIKCGGNRDSVGYITAIIKNCVVAWCETEYSSSAGGIEFIEYDVGETVPYGGAYYRANVRIYNNTLWKNAVGILGTDNDQHEYNNLKTFRNNLVFGSTLLSNGIYMDISINTSSRPWEYIESHNSWDYNDPSPSSLPWFVTTDTVTVDADDFTSALDSATIYARLSADRQSDGSLPSTHPFELVAGSDLIDAGVQIPSSDSVDFTLDFFGVSPDIGAFEYSLISKSPIFGISNKPIFVNGNIIYIQ